MIVTVRAGTPVAELHAALAEVGQRTALPERGGTVGGALVVGESGIGRLGGGHVRDALLAGPVRQRRGPHRDRRRARR